MLRFLTNVRVRSAKRPLPYNLMNYFCNLLIFTFVRKVLRVQIYARKSGLIQDDGIGKDNHNEAGAMGNDYRIRINIGGVKIDLVFTS